MIPLNLIYPSLVHPRNYKLRGLLRKFLRSKSWVDSVLIVAPYTIVSAKSVYKQVKSAGFDTGSV